MKTSELISQLQKLVAERGDLDVAIDDADTGWLLHVQEVTLDLRGSRCIAIGGDYTERFSDEYKPAS